MFKIMEDNNIQKENSALKDIDFESRQNLVGLFELLLSIDKRVNPEIYNKENKNNKDL